MYIEINGIDIYYEKCGLGDPVILLHGNGEDHKIFDVLIKQLEQNFTVYAIDSRDHGKSGKAKNLGYRAMMDDVAAFIRELKISKPILYGFSDGGIVGLLLAIEYPDMLSRLIVSGANLRPDGIKTRDIILMKITYFFSRNQKIKMMLTEPDIKEKDLNDIITPTYVLAGSKDVIKEEHTKMIAKSINNSVLRILDGENHASYVLHSEKLYEIIKPYLL